MNDIDNILYLENVNKSFDGFKAINNLSLSIKPGELRAIIGPNGAGKSTMMDLITGKTRPDDGRIIFKDTTDLTRLSEPVIANLGIGRKFQKPTVIESLSLFENLELAASGMRKVRESLFKKLSSEKQKKITETLDMVKLSHKAQGLAGDLSHGQKQWLEIGMLLMQEPEMLLVDEPAAGMTDVETMETARLLKSISVNHSVVAVEHDMDFIEALDTTVSVLHQGSIIAEGTLDKVSKDQQVIDVYLGR